jgi:hypothetical protein
LSRETGRGETEGFRAHSLEMIRDNVSLKLQEEPAMGKRLGKNEKLDLILSELAKLRGEVKKLVRDRAAVAHQDVKAMPRSAPRPPKKLPKPTGAGKKPDRDAAPSKPVSVETPRVPQPTSRTASQ